MVRCKIIAWVACGCLWQLIAYGAIMPKMACVNTKRLGEHAMEYHLIVSNKDGSDQQSLLISQEPILSPACSPDGGKVAYVSLERHRAAIYIADLVTGQRRLITAFPGVNGAPAWSPDGKQLALILSQGDSTKIFTINLKNLYLKQITHGFSIDVAPTWSLDGKNIFFLSDREGKLQPYQIDLMTHKVSRK